MFGIATQAIVATVQDKLSARDRTVCDLPSDAVCGIALALPPQPTITPHVAGARPNMAAAIGDTHLCKKLLNASLRSKLLNPLFFFSQRTEYGSRTLRMYEARTNFRQTDLPDRTWIFRRSSRAIILNSWTLLCASKIYSAFPTKPSSKWLDYAPVIARRTRH